MIDVEGVEGMKRGRRLLPRALHFEDEGGDEAVAVEEFTLEEGDRRSWQNKTESRWSSLIETLGRSVSGTGSSSRAKRTSASVRMFVRPWGLFLTR
jgi:hypothetical protein